jgi:hypothetical protein
MARLNLDLVTGSSATQYINSNLSTTPLKVLAGTVASSAFTTARRWVITNCSTGNFVAFKLSSTTTSPALVCSGRNAVAAGEGTRVFPETQFFINVHSGQDLWICASAGSTPVHVVPYDTEIR